MVRDYEKKIVEEEIGRLERAYRDAQERYGVTGSRSTDRTMTKYQVLIDALEDFLNRNRDESKDRLITRQQDQLFRLKQQLNEHTRDMDYGTWQALWKIVTEG